MLPVDDENALINENCGKNEHIVPLRGLIRKAAKRLCEKNLICQYEVAAKRPHAAPCGLMRQSRKRDNLPLDLRAGPC